MSDKSKLEWRYRFKLCWFILTKGVVEGMPEYKTKHEREQWEICQKRQAEKDATKRPKTYPKAGGRLSYSDYFER
jgi:hypothetical protein